MCFSFARLHRKSLRIPQFDYRQCGTYFVTICTHEQERILGKLANGEVILIEGGSIVEEEWMRVPAIRPNTELDEFIVMPSHFHGIVSFVGPPTNSSQSKSRAAGSLGAVVGQFKSRSARRINELRKTPGAPVWQRNYYERVLTSERELEIAREYIRSNPAPKSSRNATAIFPAFLRRIYF